MPQKSFETLDDYEENLARIFELRKVVIAFAGGNQDKFQFFPTLNRLHIPFILMRDSTQHYHGNGVKGIGTRQDVIDYIAAFVCAGNYVITLGVSSGAYAALLYGQLVPVNEVIAISPLTTRNECDDFDPQWRKQIIDPNMPLMDDLRKHFRHGPIPKTRAFISDGEATELDRQMATRIGIKDITLIPGYAHGKLAQGMRDRGMFKDLLT